MTAKSNILRSMILATGVLTWGTQSAAAADAARFERLVGKSDDYQIYKAEFMKAAEALISQQRCTDSDFIENGGWVKSMAHKDEPVYFTYCGGATKHNRIYLNAVSGKFFR